MKVYYDLLERVQEYLVSRDPKALISARDIIEDEINSPQLQESILTLDVLSTKAAAKSLQEDGFLRLTHTQVTNTPGVEVELDKYIRLIGSDAEENVATIVKVAALEPYIILVPYTPSGGSL